MLERDEAPAGGEPEEKAPDETAQRAKPRRVVLCTGRFWSFVAGLLLFAALVVLIAQNAEKVTVEWLAWEIDAPLVVVILVTALAVSVLQALVGLALRRRRRRLAERGLRRESELEQEVQRS